MVWFVNDQYKGRCFFEIFTLKIAWLRAKAILMKAVALLLCFAALTTRCYACTTDNKNLIDIVFVVDGSGSIGTDNFELVRLWLINATSTMFNRFGRRAQFEVLEYSNKDPVYKRIPIAKSTLFEIPFRLGDCQSISCMSSRIMKMRYLSSQTYTYYALRRVLEVEFPLSPHYKEAKKAMILLTDGAANDAPLLPNAYQKSVQENVTNFAIGVGNYQINQLMIFANGGSTYERVFTTTTFQSLSSVIDELDKELEREGFFCDECKSGTHNCSVHAQCLNSPDGFNCECNEGYYGNGFTCREIDYCANNPCREKENSQCIVVDFRPKCVCIEGFHEESGVCVETNECESNPCQFENSKCQDGVGYYFCTCQSGFQFDGETCTQIPTDPSDIITGVTFTVAILVIIAIVVGIVCWNRRERSYSPTSPHDDNDNATDDSSDVHGDDIPLEQQQS